MSAKFGICTVVSVNATRVNVHILASTSVPFTLTLVEAKMCTFTLVPLTLMTVQVPNLALTLTKQIIVNKSNLTDYLCTGICSGVHSVLGQLQNLLAWGGGQDAAHHGHGHSTGWKHKVKEMKLKERKKRGDRRK